MQRFASDDEARTTSYYATTGTAFVDASDVSQLKRLAVGTGGPARYCLHSSPTSALHSMVILQPRSAYSQPRKHLDAAKVFQIVDGEMALILFDEEGAVHAVHHMSRSDVLVVRVEAGVYHTNMAISSEAIYHEVVLGPFDRDSRDRVFASFAPLESDGAAGIDYLRDRVALMRPDLVNEENQTSGPG
jgi:cupin fold WbuC family metalloprotein